MILDPTDQRIRDKGFNFVPFDRYLASPFQMPESQTVASPVSAGITTLPMNMGGGGGGTYTGGVNDLITDYDKITKENYFSNQPTPLVDDLYQSKLDKTFMGFPSYREQELTGPDLGEYIGTGTDVPLELTTAGKIQGGIESFRDKAGSFMGKIKGFGPVSFIANALDRFDTLSPSDQEFIKMNMGYTGPTVFGDNQSGLSKDVYGINTRSLFGNYADYVDDFVGKYKDMEEEDFNKLSDFRKTKIGFYRQKQKELQQIREQKAKEEAAAAAAQEAAQRSAMDRMFQEGRGGRGQDFTGGRFDRAGSKAEYDRNPTGFSGSSKDGGIIGYGGTSGTPLYQQFMNGGLADLVDIYD